MPQKKTKPIKKLLQAEAWRLRAGDNHLFIYRVQVNKVSNKARPGLIKKMAGWTLTAEQVVSSNRSKKLMIFQRTFKSEEEFHVWGQKFPFGLTEYSSTSDRAKTVKLGAAAPKKRGRKKGSKNKKKAGKKRCGVCGKLGHNARTCKNK